MHQVPHPKEQARLLKVYLATLGIKLAHQPSLEALAVVMGHKNWKTMSANTRVCADTQEPVEPAQAKIPGPPDGTLYSVPVTVDMTMTARIQARGASAGEAIGIARAYASEVYPRHFSLDEGNYRGGADYYCPDADSVVKVADVATPIPAVTETDFDEETADVANNMGMSGEFSVASKDGRYLLVASLDSSNPDSSDDEARAQCVLTIGLRYGEGHAQEGTEVTHFVADYEYYGDDRSRGDHLEDLFNEGGLLDRLFAR